MAPQYRASSATQAFNTASNATITIPAAVAVGDRMYLVATYKLLIGTGTINTPSGWTVLFSPVNGPTGNSFQGAVFYKDAVSGDTGGAATVNVTCSSGSQQLCLSFAAYSGVTGVRSSSFVVGSTTSSTSVTCTAPGTAPQAGDLVVLIGTVRETTNGPSGEPTFTAPAGATIRAQIAGTSGSAQNVSSFIGDHDSSSGDRTVTASQTSVAVAGQIVLQGVTALSRGTSETLTQSDAMARQVAAPRAMAEGLTLGSAVSAGVTTARAMAAALTAADAMAAPVNRARAMAEALTAGDTIGRAVDRPRALAESLTAGDTIGRQVTTSRAAAEGLSASDAVSRTKSNLIAVSNTLTASDAPSRTLVRLAAIAEALTLGQALGRAAGQARAVGEGLTLGNTIGTGTGVTIVVSEALSVADAFARQTSRPRGITQALVLDSAITAGLALNIGAAETVTLADNQLAFRVVLLAAAETLTLADGVGRGVTAGAAFAEALTLADTFARQSAKARGVAQTLAVADGWTGGRFVYAGTSESLTLGNALARAATAYGRAVAEAVTLANTFDRQTARGRAVAEAVAFTQEWLAARSLVFSAATSELVFSDAMTVRSDRGRAVANSLGMADSAARQVNRSRTLPQAVTVAGLFKAASGVNVAAAAAITLDAVARKATARGLTVAELILLQDFMNVGDQIGGPVIAHYHRADMTSPPHARVDMTSPHGQVRFSTLQRSVRRTV